MADTVTLTKLRMLEGVWHGALRAPDRTDWTPDIVVTHLDFELKDISVEPDIVEGGWIVSVPVPAERIGDGVQTFVIRARGEDTVLGSFAILAGEALAEDIRAEVALLRAELDMVKQAFRRHCAETATD